jgi:hypothetical protein
VGNGCKQSFFHVATRGSPYTPPIYPNLHDHRHYLIDTTASAYHQTQGIEVEAKAEAIEQLPNRAKGGLGV